jgi:RHS repeat-associated protein
LLGDHLGSSSVTTDANGLNTVTALYKAFGETRYSSGNLGTDYKFTGQREQAELGLYFYGARWFDPSLGRFTSADTMIPSGVQGYDRYAYSNNNPIRYVDPSGHSPRRSDYRNQIHARKLMEAEVAAQTDEDLFEWFNITMSAEAVTDLLIELSWWIDALENISSGLSNSPLLELAGATTIGALIFAPAAPLALVAGGVTLADWATEKTLSNTVSDLNELRYQVATRSGAEYDDAAGTVVAKKSITLSAGSNIVNWNIKVNGDKVVEHSNIWLPPVSTPMTATPLWLMGWYEFDYLPGQ